VALIVGGYLSIVLMIGIVARRVRRGSRTFPIRISEEAENSTCRFSI
jgi:hypothetical protein